MFFIYILWSYKLKKTSLHEFTKSHFLKLEPDGWNQQSSFYCAEVDLMATSTSPQVPVYFSALVDDQAEGVEVFTKNWDTFNLVYVFPPPVMMELILNRIYQCNTDTRFILVSPWKPKAQWFPKLLSLTERAPLRLPLSWETVTDLAGSHCIRALSQSKSKSGHLLKSWKSGHTATKLSNSCLFIPLLISGHIMPFTSQDTIFTYKYNYFTLSTNI